MPNEKSFEWTPRKQSLKWSGTWRHFLITCEEATPQFSHLSDRLSVCSRARCVMSLCVCVCGINISMDNYFQKKIFNSEQLYIRSGNQVRRYSVCALFFLHFTSKARPAHSRRQTLDAPIVKAARRLWIMFSPGISLLIRLLYMHIQIRTAWVEKIHFCRWDMMTDECGPSSGSCHCESGNDNSDGAGANRQIKWAIRLRILWECSVFTHPSISNYPR